MTRQAAETAAQADPQPVAGPRVIWNWTAGSKAGLPTNGIDEATLRDLLRRHGLGDAIVATDSEEAARRAVRAAIAAGSRPIVAVGGDGTAYLIADELIGTRGPLGILPLGSAMNFCAQPRDPARPRGGRGDRSRRPRTSHRCRRCRRTTVLRSGVGWAERPDPGRGACPRRGPLPLRARVDRRVAACRGRRSGSESTTAP